MKNKKYFYGLLVLVLLLCAGIGFAAVSQDLIINGTATSGDDKALAENLKVNFTNKKDYEAAVGEKHAATASIVDVTTGKITATGFSAKQQTAKVVFEITNNSVEFDVNVVAKIDYLTGTIGKGTLEEKTADCDDYFLVKYYFVSADDIDAAYSLTSGDAEIEIKNSKKAYIVLEVSLEHLPISQLTEAGFTVTLTATATSNSQIN